MKKYWNIGFLNTIRLNLAYFGLRGMFHPVIIASRRVKILSLKGKVILEKALPIGAITIGFPDITSFDYRYERSIWCNNGDMIFAGKAHFGQGTRITNNGKLRFGNGFGISANTSIICDKKIFFGDNVLISWDVLIMDSDVHKIYNLKNSSKIINKPKDITVKDNVWIGCRSILLKGTSISSGSVISAGSIVNGDFQEENVVISNNKRILKHNIGWK